MRSSLILAQRLLDLLDECGATKGEKEAAIDVVAALLRQDSYEQLDQDLHETEGQT